MPPRPASPPSAVPASRIAPLNTTPPAASGAQCGPLDGFPGSAWLKRAIESELSRQTLDAP